MQNILTSCKKRAIKNKRESDNTYYAEVSLAIRVDSELNFEDIQNMYNNEEVRIKVKMNSNSNKQTIEPRVLEVWGIDWEEWDKL